MDRWKYLCLRPFIVILGLACFACESLAQASPPNVVFILVDDLGWTDLGSYGSTFYDTPHVDNLAGRGVRFTDAYAAHPVCSPTRAAILTGKDPARVGITDWIPGMPTEQAEDPRLTPPEILDHLPLEELTLAEAFEQHGYRTMFAGKWHLGEDPAYWPEYQGFEVNVGGHDRGSPPGGYYAPYENPRLADGPEGEYLTDRLTDESIRFVEAAARRQEPFFLLLSFYTVHTPIQGCRRYDGQYREQKLQLPEQGRPNVREEGHGQTRLTQSEDKYAAMVRCMDDNVGRLLATLRERGLYQNTIVVLTSDNGGLTTLPPERGIAPTAVVPLRAGKGWAYEGGIRVPLIIQAPGLPAGAVSSQAVTSMDLYPTLLELAGLPPESNQHLDGKSIVPYLTDPDRRDERTLVWHYPHYHGSAWRPGSALRQGRWKLVKFYEDEHLELYDLDSDVAEQHNLAEQRPGKAHELHQVLMQRLHSLHAGMPAAARGK